MRVDDPDRELWQRAQHGDGRAFDRLRARHTRLVYAQICKFPGVGYDDREDVAQDVWRAVWQSLPRFQGMSLFSTWLGGVATRVVCGHLRRAIRIERYTDSLPDEQIGDAETSPTQWLDRVDLHAAITKLSKEDRNVISWCMFMQLTDEEAAELLGIPLGTLKSRKRAALKRLRAILEERESEDEPSHAGTPAEGGSCEADGDSARRPEKSQPRGAKGTTGGLRSVGERR